MRVTIAGAGSFIGKRIVAMAEHQQDMDLTLVLRKGSFINLARYSKNVKLVECNMEDYAELGKKAGKGECFIDLSWMGSRGTDRQDQAIQRFNYECSMKAMKSMANAGYRILISAGSQAEYGQCNAVITEETPLKPNTEYGKYKVQIYQETAELCMKAGIRFIEPRYFSLYGPGDYSKTLIMGCIEKMRKNMACELNECTQLWDYLYIDDAIEALFALCRNEKATGAYNFATGEYRMLREFVMDIHKALRSKSFVQFGSPGNTLKGLIINLQPSVDKLKRDASWSPETSFIDGIRKTAQSFVTGAFPIS